jgi:phage tail tape-measure protein
VFSKTAGVATTASTVASDIKNGASTVLNGIKNIGSAPVVGATTQVLGDIKSGAGIAIDAAAKATKSVPSSVMSGLSSSMGWIAKKAPIITAALAAIDVGTIATDDKLDRHQKVEGASKSIGMSAGAAGGAWAGAATGAAIGSVVPVLGTGVGGVIGGVIGGIAGGWGGGKVGGIAGEAVGKGVNATIDYVSPTQPSVDGQSVTPNLDITKSTTATDNSVISNQSNTTQMGNVAVAPDDKSILNKSVNDMLQILTNIFNLLQAQAEELNGSSEKQIALQERLHRALKNSGIGYSEAPASQSYN